MPNFNFSNQPRFPLVLFDSDEPITSEQLKNLFSKNKKDIMLCFRSKNGDEKRGGFFFCISKTEKPEHYSLETMEGEHIKTFPFSDLVKFINHVAGKKFDYEMLNYCQNNINFRNDL